MTSPIALSASARPLAVSARLMALGTLVSRTSGFVRVVVVTNVLGATYLANVYQSANSIPNLLFELLAAGVLQAVLVPALISALNARGRSGAGELAGLVLGRGGVVLGLVVGVGIVAAPSIMRGLTADVADAAVRSDQIRIGTVFLWWFLPQILVYLANSVAVALLNVDGRFALAAITPAINNVVVISAYLVFAAVRPAGPVSLDIGSLEQLILAAGTTAAVVAFCAPTIVAAARRFPCRPRLVGETGRLRPLIADGLWAMLFVAGTQIFLLVTLYVLNRDEGSVAVYQLVWVVFLLPYSVAMVPIITTRFPAATRAAAADDWTSYGDVIGGGLRSLFVLGAPAAGLVIGGAGPVSRLLVRGDVAQRSEDIAHGIVGFGAGLLLYALLMFAVRGCYAVGDTSSPAIVNSVAVAIGLVVVLWAAPHWNDRSLVLGIGIVHSAISASAALVLWVLMMRRLRGSMASSTPPGRVPTAPLGPVFVPAVRALGSGVVAALGAMGLGLLLDQHILLSDIAILMGATLIALCGVLLSHGATNRNGIKALVGSLGAEAAVASKPNPSDQRSSTASQ